jgi:hypothetical protein
MRQEAIYPSVAEQEAVLKTVKRRYRIRYDVKPSDTNLSFWRVTDWYAKQEAFYLHLERGSYHYYSLIQADYREYRFITTADVFLKIDRATRTITEITEEAFKTERASQLKESARARANGSTRAKRNT